MTMMITLKDEHLIKLTGHDGVVSITHVIMYWKNYGQPSFEGPLSDFEKKYPEIVQELVDKKVLQKND